jgi:hypothetical protein
LARSTHCSAFLKPRLGLISAAAHKCALFTHS